MEHRKCEELERIADVHKGAVSVEPMSKTERLERWAMLLQQKPNRVLNSLRGTEYLPPEARDNIRQDNSPISVALEDPILHADGLDGDTYSAAKKYFELSDGELHQVVCYCFCGATMTAQLAALRVRSLIPKSTSQAGLTGRVLRFLGC